MLKCILPQKGKLMKQEILNKLNDDLKNEWKHHCFYLHAASTIQGIESIEYKEFLVEQSKEEFDHVLAFSDMIVGLGGVPTKQVNDYPTLSNTKEILEYALLMEEEVVKNYVERIAEAEELGGVDGRWIVIFLESQIEDSRKDLDKIRQLLK
jgi:bacterioferritin (cytochrome b1)